MFHPPQTGRYYEVFFWASNSWLTLAFCFNVSPILILFVLILIALPLSFLSIFLYFFFSLLLLWLSPSPQPLHLTPSSLCFSVSEYLSHCKAFIRQEGLEVESVRHVCARKYVLTTRWNPVLQHYLCLTCYNSCIELL